MGKALRAPKVVLNPFLDEYTQQEIEFFGLKRFRRKFRGKIIEVKWGITPLGQFPDYLNRNFRICHMGYPHLYVDGTMWMSLSYMEAQSHWVPLQLAEGKVGVLGLGLGYYVLRVMAIPFVDSVDVYEQEPGVIKYFQECFSDREGFEKVTFICGDARTKMVGKAYDFVYSDIYLRMWEPEAVSDLELFQGNNKIGTYFPWGLERVLFEAMNEYSYCPGSLPTPVKLFFKFFLTTEIDTGRGTTFKPSELLHQDGPSEDLVTEVILGLDWL